MIIKWIDVAGFESAIKAMRAPMRSWEKSDSEWVFFGEEPSYVIGEKDKELSLKLQDAGPEHCKHLRMIMAYAEIDAPLFWLKQLDTYRTGVEKVSTSTMHTIMKFPFQPSDFEHDCINDEYYRNIVDSLNGSRETWLCTKDPEYKKEIWRGVIEALPESYIQKRFYMFSYAALRNIVRQREGHKLYEWEMFIKSCKDLPESWMIF